MSRVKRPHQHIIGHFGDDKPKSLITDEGRCLVGKRPANLAQRLLTAWCGVTAEYVDNARAPTGLLGFSLPVT